MRFAKWVFLASGIYGLLLIPPHYFLEARIGRDYPPPITHPEYFYGFVGVTLAWQVLFFVIASNPVRLRPAMLPAVLEKAAFAVAAPALYLAGRVHVANVVFGVIDAVWGVLFLVSWLKTRDAERGGWAGEQVPRRTDC